MTQGILIIGAGFGGVWSALSAMRLLDQHGNPDVAVTVLAPQAELGMRPRFYEADVHRMKADVGELFDAVGVNFVKGTADRIDVAGKRVAYTDAAGVTSSLPYDRLVLAAGSHVVRPNVSGIQEHAFDVGHIDEAVRLEQHIRGLKTRPASAARNTVAVAGGGFTGIETATEMPARLREALGEDADVRVIVIDRGQSIGAAMGKDIAAVIAEASKDLGVEWKLNASVAAVDANGVTLSDGERIESNTVIWTVGFRASALTGQIPGERDHLGRLHVDRNLKVIGQQDIYATGDVAYAATDDDGNHTVMSCQHAIALGRAAGTNVAADILGVAPRPYSQPKYVTCLDLGPWGAVFTEGWDRQVKLVREEAKQLKTQINTIWIYPPAANRALALAAADPAIPVA